MVDGRKALLSKAPLDVVKRWSDGGVLPTPGSHWCLPVSETVDLIAQMEPGHDRNAWTWGLVSRTDVLDELLLQGMMDLNTEGEMLKQRVPFSLRVMLTKLDEEIRSIDGSAFTGVNPNLVANIAHHYGLEALAGSELQVKDLGQDVITAAVMEHGTEEAVRALVEAFGLTAMKAVCQVAHNVRTTNIVRRTILASVGLAENGRRDTFITPLRGDVNAAEEPEMMLGILRGVEGLPGDASGSHACEVGGLLDQFVKFGDAVKLVADEFQGAPDWVLNLACSAVRTRSSSAAAALVARVSEYHPLEDPVVAGRVHGNLPAPDDYEVDVELHVKSDVVDAWGPDEWAKLGVRVSDWHLGLRKVVSHNTSPAPSDRITYSPVPPNLARQVAASAKVAEAFREDETHPYAEHVKATLVSMFRKASEDRDLVELVEEVVEFLVVNQFADRGTWLMRFIAEHLVNMHVTHTDQWDPAGLAHHLRRFRPFSVQEAYVEHAKELAFTHQSERARSAMKYLLAEAGVSARDFDLCGLLVSTIRTHEDAILALKRAAPSRIVQHCEEQPALLDKLVDWCQRDLVPLHQIPPDLLATDKVLREQAWSLSAVIQWNVVQAYVADAVHARVGGDQDAWEVASRLLSAGWEGSLEEFLDTVKATV